MTLAALQRSFVDYLKADPRGTVGGVPLSALRGLPVYHHAYRAALIAALRDTFERVHSWLGDEQFDAAARRHITDHPPASWTMSDYGTGFDATLAALYPDDPEVGELAWLDWTLRRAFEGPDADPVDPTQLADIDWDTACLTLVPTLRMRRVTTNCAPLWSALDDDHPDPPDPVILDDPVVLTVWRHDLQPRFATVSDLEHQALVMAGDGIALGPICEALVAEGRSAEVVAADVGAILGRWIAEGVLVAVGPACDARGTWPPA